MKIAFISTVHGYRWAGTEEVWYAAALRAVSAGHQVSAFVHSDVFASDQIANLISKGVDVHPRHPLRFSRLWPLKEKIVPTFPVDALNHNDAILVSLGSWLDLFYVPGLLPALRKCTAPLFLFCQFNAEGLAISPFQRSELRALVGSSAGCCFVSRHNWKLTERQLAMSLPAARVFLNPIRVSLPKPLPWPEEGVVRMACVARLETLWKGQDLLLETLGASPWRERIWKLSFFGEGPDRDHLQNAIQFYGLQDRVQLRGYVRELKDIWHNHHLMILPSRGEGLPLAILEAMMCGRPTVATDAGGNREILDHATGFIAEGATPVSLGKALESAWSAQSDWPRMGLAAHERATQIASGDPTGQLLEYLFALGRKNK